MRPELALHPQDTFPDLAGAEIDDRGLPFRVSFAQFIEQTSGKPEFGQRTLELIVVLEFLALLRGHVGLEKDLARVVRLSGQLPDPEEKTKTGAQNQTDFLHDLKNSDDMHVWLGCNAGLHREEN